MSEIPIFPLQTVLYPCGLLPLRIFEQRYVEMTKRCIAEDSVFGVCLILDGREAGAPAVPHAVGCTARIVDWDVPSPGLFNLRTRGETTFRIVERRIEPDGLIRAEVVLHEAPPAPASPPEEHRALERLLSRIIDEIGAQHLPAPLRLDDPAWVCHRLAELLDLPLAAKQRLLETADASAKAALLSSALRAMVSSARDTD